MFNKRLFFIYFLVALHVNLPIFASLEEGVIIENGSGDGKKMFLEQVRNAKNFLVIGAYKMQKELLPDEEIMQTLTEASKKIPSKIILESRLTPEEIHKALGVKEGDSLRAVKKTGAQILSDLPEFKNIHLKLLLTSDIALVGTTNYDNHSEDFFIRNFTLILRDSKLLNEIKEVLYNAEHGKAVILPSYTVRDIQNDSTRLSWGPYQHLDHLLQMIDQAKEDIAIYQQDIQDTKIVEALEKKLTNGVKVRILMSNYPFGKERPNKSYPNQLRLVKKGAEVRLTGKKIFQDDLPLHIHAKVLIVDGGTDHQLMYLGSANFYPPIFDPEERNLNLGCITCATKYVIPVLNTFEDDWAFHEDQRLVAEH